MSEVGDLVVLDDRAGGEDRLRVARVVRERVAQKVERLVVLAEAEVEQPDRREQLRILPGRRAGKNEWASAGRWRSGADVSAVGKAGRRADAADAMCIWAHTSGENSRASM